MLVEQSVSSNTNNAWTPPVTVYSWQLACHHKAIVVMRRMGALHCFLDFTTYVLHSLLCACWALCVSWTNFCFNECIYALYLLLVEHSVSSNTNNAWTPPLTVHSGHVTIKPLWWQGGWAHWIVFMTSLCSLPPCFVLAEHSVFVMNQFLFLYNVYFINILYI